MTRKIKSFYLFITSVIIGLVSLPFSFAKSATGAKLFDKTIKNNSKSLIDSSNLLHTVASVYDSLHLNLSGLSQQAYDFAKKGFDKLIAEGKLLNDSLIAVIDFSMPSKEKRMFILDTKNYKVLFQTLVAHGRNTGREWAEAFSNSASSYKSSPGFYITRETYEGKNGYSLKLEGIEKGINDNAYERGIVIHGAAYVNEDLAKSQGYIGRSQGCPAVPVSLSAKIINAIKNGTCVFIYHPSYLQQSQILR